MINVPVRVKDALRDGRLLKRYKINVYRANGALDFTIGNDNLVTESVSFNEKMCSGDVLKFGLCEGTSLEFQYFDKPDILGRQIKVNLDVQYINASGNKTWYNNLPMGYFTVQKCPQQFSTGIYKVTAYNKLQSNYLDTRANELLIDAYNNQDSYSPSTIEKILDMVLDEYKIDSYKVRLHNTKIETNLHNAVLAAKYGDLGVYRGSPPPGSGSTVDGYLHWFAPYVTVQFANSGHYYKFKISTSTFKSNAVSLIDPFYADWRTPDDESLYDWVQQPGTSLTDMRAGAWVFNYTGTGSATNVTDYAGNYGSEYESPYYYTINNKTESAAEAYQIGFYCPAVFVIDQNPTYTGTDWENYLTSSWHIIHNDARGLIDNSIDILQQKSSPASSMTVGSEIETWPEVTLRDLQSAIFEMQCQFGQLSRSTDLFAGVELNLSALYPADTLYPANNLYPGGTRERTVKSGYSKLWSEAGNVQKWRNLIITYKGLDENNNPTDLQYEDVINADGTQDYVCDDNWLFKNLIWTQTQIADYADAMIAKMQDVTWFPFEMWGAGLPYIETGDQIEIVDPEGNTETSYILSRQLQGIQNLQDTFINGVLDIF